MSGCTREGSDPCSTRHLYPKTCPSCLKNLFNNGCIESFETYKKEGWTVSRKLQDQINAIQKVLLQTRKIEIEELLVPKKILKD